VFRVVIWPHTVSVESEPTKYWHPSKRGGTSLLPSHADFPGDSSPDGSKFFPRRAQTLLQGFTLGDVELERPVLREWRDSMSRNRLFLCSITSIKTAAFSQPARLSMLGMPQDEGEAGSMARLPSILTRRVPLNSAPCRSQRRKRPRANTNPHRCGISWE